MTTPDFSYIEEQTKPIKETVRHTFTRLAGKPFIDLVRADESNEPYFNARLKAQREHRRSIQKGNMTVDIIQSDRHVDRELFPIFIVKGWGCEKYPEQVADAKGKPVDLNRENCESFLKAIPDDMFDEARDKAADIDNFRADGTESTAGAATETGKN